MHLSEKFDGRIQPETDVTVTRRCLITCALIWKNILVRNVLYESDDHSRELVAIQVSLLLDRQQRVLYCLQVIFIIEIKLRIYLPPVVGIVRPTLYSNVIPVALSIADLIERNIVL